MSPLQKTVWKIVGGVAIVAVPASFNYLAARLDSNEAKVLAEAGYAQMVKTVEGLQTTVHDLELKQARLEGQVHELRRIQAARVGAAPPAIEPPAPPPNPAMKAPPRFDEAVREYKNLKR